MKLARASMLLLALAAITSFHQVAMSQEEPPPVKYDPVTWTEFAPAEGRFSVLYPRLPAETTGSVDSPYGKLAQHTFFVQLIPHFIAGVKYPDPYSLPTVILGVHCVELPQRALAAAEAKSLF